MNTDIIKKILNEHIKEIRVEESEIKKIKSDVKKFCLKLKDKIKNKKIDAQVFIGGSLAKHTLIKKDKYDVDVFVRFNKKYSNELSNILKEILGKDVKTIHGSRDYFQIKKDKIVIEIVPVIKIKRPEEALNVTDLSYFHVKYVKDKLKKNKSLIKEIKLAKSFCEANRVYGAESYIKGFSGYSIELLIIHYGSFLKFIEAIAENKKDQIIIDDLGFYKRGNVLSSLNETKTRSPIILIDPTFKERNVLAGLSYETFLKFKKICKEFLKKPALSFFKKKDIYGEIKNENGLRIISIKTNKPRGDVAGTKSKKFFNFFINELKKEFEVKKAEFEYNEMKNIAYFYLVLNKKKDEIIKGPPVCLIENFNNFKRTHPNIIIKNNIAYAKISHIVEFEEFFKNFLEKNKKIIKDMSIKEIKILKSF